MLNLSLTRIHRDLLLFLALGCVLSITALPSPIKYGVLSAGVVALLVMMRHLRTAELATLTVGLFPAIYSCFLFIFSHAQPSTYFYKYAAIHLIIYGGVIFLSRISKPGNHAVFGYFLGLAVAYLILCIVNEKASFSILGISFTEHTTSFAFAVTSLFFLHRRLFFLALISTIFCILAGKRMALGALGVAVAYHLLAPSRLNKSALCFLTFLCIFAFDVAFSYAVSKVPFVISLMREANDQGRLQLYSYLTVFSLLGNGLGSAVNVLDSKFGGEFNVHSDSIQSVYDLGYLGHGLWLFSCFVAFSRSGKFVDQATLKYALSNVVFLSVSGITDNVHLYVIVIIPIFLCVLLELTNGAPSSRITK